MTLEGFVTVGRMSLLLSLAAIIVLMFALGYIVAQLVAIIRRPAVAAPKCERAHCTDPAELQAWARFNDYAVITQEIWQQVQDELARYRTVPTGFLPVSDDTLSPDQLADVEAFLNAAQEYKGRHRAH